MNPDVRGQTATSTQDQRSSILAVLQHACRKIAPVWSLENFVAVNPYLGLADHTFNEAAEVLHRVGGIQMTLPVAFYLQALQAGKMRTADVQEALFKDDPAAEAKATALLQHAYAVEDPGGVPGSISTVADVVSRETGKDWLRFATDRTSAWAASYFDNGQALWVTADQKASVYTAWKAEATVDRTPSIMGLPKFASLVQALPEDPLEAARFALAALQVPEAGLDSYLHRLLVRIGGWSAYAARIDWDSKLYGGKDGALVEFLCILLCWEACLLNSLTSSGVQLAWDEAKQGMRQATSDRQTEQVLELRLQLQQAFDHAAQRRWIDQFAHPTPTVPPKRERVSAQAIFCIDVRSEVYRRNLERVAPGIATLGFAGFFAFPISFIPLGHKQGLAQCPVLLPTGPAIMEELPNPARHAQAVRSRKLSHHVQRAWRSFKLGAISCFSFVGPVGLMYLPKLFTDSFGLTRPVPHPDREGLPSTQYDQRKVSLEVGRHAQGVVGIPLNEQVQMAKSALQAMSLTEDFARLVLIVGHGSTTVNNPYATGLDCGACGGHTGEANARVAAAVLNQPGVRAGLQAAGVLIPEDTHFMACQHDTTTDEVALFNADEIPSTHLQEVADLRQQLQAAGHAARAERALRLGITDTDAIDQQVIARSKDWAQVRPEWGLAGCSAFIVAPRSRTAGLDLGGRSFLHSYDWKSDSGFGVLELIMTAPMVVASWISLQYYASTVDNEHYGSGNKTLHNVTAGIGVLEGYAGDLRTGLPWQSVHDGRQYQHDPLRLNVIIEAPIAAMNEILAKHAAVRQLPDHGWLHLLAMDSEGRVSHRYLGDLAWESVA